MNAIVRYLAEIQSTIHQLSLPNIEKAIYWLHEARLDYQHVFLMGNGGSAATASHFSCDLTKSTRVQGCPDFRVISLGDNLSTFSAYSNDEGYENAFANQLSSLLEPGDVVVAFSASGNSPNILNAIELANQRGARTIGFTGTDGGKLRELVQVEVHVHNPRADQTEDMHLMLAHLMSRVLGELAKPSILVFEAAAKPEVPIGSIVAHNPEANTQLIKGKISHILDQSLETLQDIGQSLVVRQDGDGRVMSRVLLKMIVNFGATSGSVFVLDGKGRVSEGFLAYGEQAWTSNRRRILEFMERGLAGWVVKNRQGALILNTNDDPRWVKHPGDGRAQTSFSVMSAPIRNHGHITGVITLSRPDTDQFIDADLSMLTAMMMTVSYSMSANEGK
jgi:D-sedoheptulose 7-phosphate isomerase